MTFVVKLSCCGRDDGTHGPATWAECDAFRESYVGTDGHQRSGVIVAVVPMPSAPADVVEYIASLPKQITVEDDHMTTARQEKPSVPTPDAGEVWAHHMSLLSKPALTALRRYVDAEVKARVAELEAANKKLVAHANAVAEATGVYYEWDYGWQRGEDEAVLAAINAHVEQDRLDMEELDSACNDDFPVDDPTKQRMRDEQDALLAGYASARSKGARAGDQGPGLDWRWEEGNDEEHGAWHHPTGAYFADRADQARYFVCDADDEGRPWESDDVHEAARLALEWHNLPAELPAARATPSPAAGAVALAEPWPADAMKVPPDWDLRKDGNWVHEPTGARVCKNTDGRWDYCMGSAGPEYSCGGFFDSAEEALLTVTRNLNGRTPLERASDAVGSTLPAAAASTAPAVVRGDGAIDWEAVRSAYACEHDDATGCVEALREYHYHLDARLAQLEAAAGKKAGA